jgi:peptide/nickel transport system substrate-binding protein
MPPAVKPKPGGTLSYPLVTAPAGFDVHMRPSYGPPYAMPVFNNLVRFDPMKRDITADILVPDLAERWEVSPDGKGMTFYLRKGVKWHNGSPFTADDVVYSIQKMTDSKRSGIAAVLAPAFDRVEKTDDSTVKVFLKQPSAIWLMQLGGSYGAIQSRSTAGIDSRSTDFLMGTGPFKFKAAVPGVSYEYIKNPDYFKPGLPYLDGLKIMVTSDTAAQMSAFATGRFDVTGILSGIRNQEAMDTLKSQAPSVVVQGREITPGPKLWMNPDFAPFKDIRVRQALTLLIENKSMAVAVLGNPDWAVYNVGIFTTAYSLPGSEVAKIMGWDQPWDARVVQAKKLMADAGYASGFKMRLLVSNAGETQRECVVVADQFKRNLNVDCEIVPKDLTTLRTMEVNHDFEMVHDGTSTTIGDPDEVMGYFMTGNQANFLKYSNPAADKLWQQQSIAVDPVQRKQLTQQIDRLVLSDHWIIPVHGGMYYVGWWPYVQGFINPNMSYGSNIVFEQAWLNK